MTKKNYLLINHGRKNQLLVIISNMTHRKVLCFLWNCRQLSFCEISCCHSGGKGRFESSRMLCLVKWRTVIDFT